MKYLKTALSKVASAVVLRAEGLSLNATARVLQTQAKTIRECEKRFSGQKSALKLYALVHQFICLTLEADEIYTRVGKNRPPKQSQGWTFLVMDRASRFILEMECNSQDQTQFLGIMTDLVEQIENSQDITIF